MDVSVRAQETLMRYQPRFPHALKQARLAKHLKQETLAALAGVKLRTLVSWETGTRIPSIGIVILLLLLLTGEMAMDHEIVRTYIADDLARQASVYEDHEERARLLAAFDHFVQEHWQDEQRKQPEERDVMLLSQQGKNDKQEELPAQQEPWRRESPSGNATQDRLQQLFSVVEILHQHPELIAVTQDFLREVARDEPKTPF